jgi:3-deoxy-D-manno-octulosonate 8-phosphate phosphatase (KDO 8-P phosphatase)
MIRAVALDVDGVLTDGTFLWGAEGEMKRFHFLDVMGIARAMRSGVVFALISGEESPIVRRFANKLGIRDVFVGCKDKASALGEFAARHDIPLAEVCFMGDDVNDVPALLLAGVAAAPANAHFTAADHATIRTHAAGGNGAVRELLDRLAEDGRLTMMYETQSPREENEAL